MAMTSLSRDTKQLFAINAPKYVLARALAVSTAESITVPTDAKFVLFNSTENIFVNYTTTATVPGDVTDGTASELNPELRDITGVTTISVITPASGGAIVTAAFYV